MKPQIEITLKGVDVKLNRIDKKLERISLIIDEDAARKTWLNFIFKKGANNEQRI